MLLIDQIENKRSDSDLRYLLRAAFQALRGAALFLVFATTADFAQAESKGQEQGLRDPKQFAPLTGPVAGDEATGFVSRGLGVLGLMTDAPGGPLGGGGALLMRGSALLFGPIASAHYQERHWIGWDSRGATYSVSVQGAAGLRWELEGNHGPFARVEARGEMQRVGGFYYSSLRIPGVQIGYGLDRGSWMLDFFAHLSPSWTGRVRTVEFTRPVEGAFTGGAFSLGWNNWILHADASHLLGFDGGFLDVRSALCSYWGKKPTRLSNSGKIATRIGPRSTDYSFAICTDGSSLTFPRSGEIQQKTEVGLSFVFGTFSRLDRTAVP